MKNIHILPTDKPSRLIKNNLGIAINEDFTQSILDLIQAKFINIYITSNEEIKANDYITDGYRVFQCKYDCSLLGRKKVILTTDPELIADGVQAIDDEFLEWFAKNPNCDSVEVDTSNFFNGKIAEYILIIPKEESKQENFYEQLVKYFETTPREKVLEDWEKTANLDNIKPTVDEFLENTKQQETLEEAAENNWDKINSKYKKGVNPYAHKIGFIEGAKWQQKRIYSEKDMAEAFMACWKANVPEGIECKLSFKEWLKQFKKNNYE